MRAWVDNGHQWKDLFQEHLAGLLEVLDFELPKSGFTSLVLSAGEETRFFEDDQSKVFRSHPSFRYLCPATGPGHLLILSPGRRPRLILNRPSDYWHAPEPEPENWWAESFDLSIAASDNEAWSQGSLLPGPVAFLGEHTARASQHGFVANPFLVQSLFNWLRSFKSPYEVECLQEANEKGLRGHEAARKAFFEGKSEFEIHLAFLQASGQLERELPYESIVATGSHAAVLHYQHKSRAARSSSPQVLLIDAGASVRGYPSDITRTWLRESDESEPCRVFESLLKALQELQSALCDRVRPGVGFRDLQLEMQRGVAQILRDKGIVSGLDPDTEEGLDVARHFIPHGVGHLLGLFVHDVGGLQADRLGRPLTGERVPNLRSLRTLEAQMVLTIEPGLYFIPELLERLRQSERCGPKVAWSLVESLVPYGGIRIEDNVLVTAEGEGGGHRNLTRSVRSEARV